MSWHFTTIDDDSRNLKDPTESTVQSHGELRQTQIFVREVLQNALDNRAGDSPVQVDFRLSYLKGKAKTSFLDAINFNEVVPHIRAVRDYQLETRKYTNFPDTEKILNSNYVLKLLYIIVYR